MTAAMLLTIRKPCLSQGYRWSVASGSRRGWSGSSGSRPLFITQSTVSGLRARQERSVAESRKAYTRASRTLKGMR